MHYNRAFFSRFPVMLDTLIPLNSGVEIGQRKALSRFDILQANLLYQCDGKSVYSSLKHRYFFVVQGYIGPQNVHATGY